MEYFRCKKKVDIAQSRPAANFLSFGCSIRVYRILISITGYSKHLGELKPARKTGLVVVASTEGLVCFENVHVIIRFY